MPGLPSEVPLTPRCVTWFCCCCRLVFTTSNVSVYFCLDNDKCYALQYIHQIIYIYLCIQVNLDMTDSMGPGKLVCHMQNLSYTYEEYLICIGLGPSISSVICKKPSYSGPSYPSSPVYTCACVCMYECV